MSTVDWLGFGANAAEAVAVSATLIYVAKQLRIQQKEISANEAAVTFQTYQQISGRYSDLLWKASEDDSLNAIWFPLAGERVAQLNAAQASGIWGAWSIMSAEERKGYRYTRSALEVFEQAHHVHRARGITDETWSKWEAWIRVWIATAFFSYVLEDSRARLLAPFVGMLEQMVASGLSPGSGLAASQAD